MIDIVHTLTSVVYQSMTYRTHTEETADRVLTLSPFTQSVNFMTLVFVYKKFNHLAERMHYYCIKDMMMKKKFRTNQSGLLSCLFQILHPRGREV